MQLIPEFLPVGSIVDRIYDNGKINPIIIDADDIDNCQKFNKLFNELHRPIPLTEKILTEWCLFKYIKEVGGYCNDKHLIYKTINGYRFMPHCTDDDDCGIEINYLHELQLIYTAYKTALPIQIK